MMRRRVVRQQTYEQKVQQRVESAPRNVLAILSSGTRLNQAIEASRFIQDVDGVNGLGVREDNGQPFDYIEFLYSDRFQPAVHLSHNAGRVEGALRQALGDDACARYDYTNANICENEANNRQREAIILAAICASLENAYIEEDRPEWDAVGVAQGDGDFDGSDPAAVARVEALNARMIALRSGALVTTSLGALRTSVPEIVAALQTFSNEGIHTMQNDTDSDSDDEEVLTSRMGVVRVKFDINKWLPRILFGVVIALGIAAMIATTVLTLGAVLPLWAIVTGFAVGAGLLAVGGIGEALVMKKQANAAVQSRNAATVEDHILSNGEAKTIRGVTTTRDVGDALLQGRARSLPAVNSSHTVTVAPVVVVQEPDTVMASANAGEAAVVARPVRPVNPTRVVRNR